MQSLFCTMWTQHEDWSFLGVPEQPTYRLGRVRWVTWTRVSSVCFVFILVWVSAGEREMRGLRGRNFINFKRVVGITPSMKCPSATLPLTRESHWLLTSLLVSVLPCLWVLSSYQLSSLLVTDLSMFTALPLAQGQDSLLSSVVWVNISVLVVLTGLHHLEVFSHKKTVIPPGGIFVLDVHNSNNSPSHKKITWDNVNKSVFWNGRFIQNHSSSHSFMPWIFVKTLSQHHQHPVNKMLSGVHGLMNC